MCGRMTALFTALPAFYWPVKNPFFGKIGQFILSTMVDRTLTLRKHGALTVNPAAGVPQLGALAPVS